MDYNLPGSSVHGISQARILEWVAISFCRGSSLLRNWIWVSCIAVRFFTDWAMREAHNLCFWPYFTLLVLMMGFPGSSAGKESTCSVGDPSLIPGFRRSPGEGNGCPLQYSDLENSMDCIAHGTTKSGTWWSDFHFHFSPDDNLLLRGSNLALLFPAV